MPEREITDEATDVTRISISEDMEGIWVTRSWRGDLENDVLRMTESEVVEMRDVLDEFLAQNGGFNEDE